MKGSIVIITPGLRDQKFFDKSLGVMKTNGMQLVFGTGKHKVISTCVDIFVATPGMRI